MPRTRIIDKDLGWDAIMRAVEKEARKGEQVSLVGWEDPEQAAKAFWNEFGTETMRAQPSMRPGFDAAQRELAAALEQAALAVLDGHGSATARMRAAEILRTEIARRVPVDTGEMERALKILEGEG